MGGGLIQLLAYGRQDKFRKFFICDVKMLTRYRVYNTFKVINHYEDMFSEATIIPNFYDKTRDTFFN